MVILGEKYRDAVTGFEGIATARSEYLAGCVRVLIEGPALADGKEHERWLDEPRLEAATPKKARREHSTGGPAPEPPNRDPAR